MKHLCDMNQKKTVIAYARMHGVASVAWHFNVPRTIQNDAQASYT